MIWSEDQAFPAPAEMRTQIPLGQELLLQERFTSRLSRRVILPALGASATPSKAGIRPCQRSAASVGHQEATFLVALKAANG